MSSFLLLQILWFFLNNHYLIWQFYHIVNWDIPKIYLLSYSYFRVLLEIVLSNKKMCEIENISRCQKEALTNRMKFQYEIMFILLHNYENLESLDQVLNQGIIRNIHRLTKKNIWILYSYKPNSNKNNYKGILK